MNFSIKDFFGTCDQETGESVTFTEEILNGKLHFLCSIGRFYYNCTWSYNILGVRKKLMQRF